MPRCSPVVAFLCLASGFAKNRKSLTGQAGAHRGAVSGRQRERTSGARRGGQADRAHRAAGAGRFASSASGHRGRTRRGAPADGYTRCSAPPRAAINVNAPEPAVRSAARFFRHRIAGGARADASDGASFHSGSERQGADRVRQGAARPADFRHGRQRHDRASGGRVVQVDGRRGHRPRAVSRQSAGAARCRRRPGVARHRSRADGIAAGQGREAERARGHDARALGERARGAALADLACRATRRRCGAASSPRLPRRARSSAG